MLGTGSVSVVEIAGTSGAIPFDEDLGASCSASFAPTGAFCDEGPEADHPFVSVRDNVQTAATWELELDQDGAPTADGVGYLVVDLGEEVEFSELIVFQQEHDGFESGRTTDIRFSVHAETGGSAPSFDDAGWFPLDEDFASVEAGETNDEGLTMTSPTVIAVNDPATRYLLIEVQNDGGFGLDHDEYIELRSVKMYAERCPTSCDEVEEMGLAGDDGLYALYSLDDDEAVIGPQECSF